MKFSGRSLKCYEQVAKRIANIRLTIYRMKRKENKKYGYSTIPDEEWFVFHDKESNGDKGMCI